MSERRDPLDIPPLTRGETPETPGQSGGGGRGPGWAKREDLLEVVRQGRPVQCNCGWCLEQADELDQLNHELDEAAQQLMSELGALEQVEHLKKLLDSAYNKVAELESERERQQNEGDLTPRAAMLREAERLIVHDRNDKCGDPEDNFADIGAMWSAYKGIDFSPWDVAAMMVLVKVCRMRKSPGHRDHWVDAAGYAACGWECIENGIQRGLEEESSD